MLLDKKQSPYTQEIAQQLKRTNKQKNINVQMG